MEKSLSVLSLHYNTLNSDISVEKSITMERLVVILILQILQFHFIDGENDEKVKRLLLNDPDVVGQISRMQNNINSLTQLVSQLTSKLNTVESELAAQNLKNTGKETCIKISTVYVLPHTNSQLYKFLSLFHRHHFIFKERFK